MLITAEIIGLDVVDVLSLFDEVLRSVRGFFITKTRIWNIRITFC